MICGGEHDAPHESGKKPALLAPVTVTRLPDTLPPRAAENSATKQASASWQFLTAPISMS